MPSKQEHIEALVNLPREALSIELKTWFDVTTPEGKAKIAKSCLAMRNNNGGFILIGFNDKTRQPDYVNAPRDVRSAFHDDVIQEVVTHYASTPFEVYVHFADRDGHTFPVLEVESGIRTPVAAKRDLRCAADKEHLVRCDRVYVRSLEANNRASTTEATWKDWERIVTICFDNREADIGNFLRRHLGGLTADSVREIVSGLLVVTAKPIDEVARENLRGGFERFQSVVGERELDLPVCGTVEVSLVINATMPNLKPDHDFLNLLNASNPNLTGWPAWLDTRGFNNRSSHPYVFAQAWEALVFEPKGSMSTPLLDFWRVDPAGRFYLLRGRWEDLGGATRNVSVPGTVFDPILAVIEVGEALATGLAFARAMDCTGEQVALQFIFRWSGLKGRQVYSPNRFLRPGRIAIQDQIEADVLVPLETPESALTQYVDAATRDLFALFDGLRLDPTVIGDVTGKLLTRRL